jgi:hypothetical protein
MVLSSLPGSVRTRITDAGARAYQGRQHDAVELVPAHPGAVHLFDDTRDDDGLALVVVKSLADEVVLVFREQRFGKRRA